jgi:hypothetical protein
MNNFQNNTTNQQKRPQRGMASHANFIEALKSAGTGMAKDTAKSFKQDLIKGSANQMMDTLFNTNQGGVNQNGAGTGEQPPFDFAEYLKASEHRTRAQERVKYEYEHSETIVFNQRKQEVEKKIDQIRIEIKKIARGIVGLDQSIQAVIQQEVTNPGTYHLNFFEKLLSFLQYMNKRVTESRHWASMHSQRSQTKSYYWSMAGKKKGGTMFSMSQERTVATQSG